MNIMLNKLLIGILTVVTCTAGLTFADDTELYLVDSTVRTGKRPQVLFIFDNSGSMSTVEENAVTSYCSETDSNAGVCSYPDGFGTFLESYSGYINDKGTYWNAGGLIIPVICLLQINLMMDGDFIKIIITVIQLQRL